MTHLNASLARARTMNFDAEVHQLHMLNRKRNIEHKFQEQAHSSSLIIPNGGLQVMLFVVALFLTFAVVYCFCLVYNNRTRPRLIIQA